MKNIFSLLPEEIDAAQRQEFVTDPSIELDQEPIVVEEQAPMKIESRSRPANINLGMPIDRTPLVIEEGSSDFGDVENQPEQQEPSIVDRYKEIIEKQRQTDDSEYQDTSNKSNRMQLYGNLLRGFQNMVQNSVSGVAPNFKADMGVADNLVEQGKAGLAEFYKKRNNARDERNQTGTDLTKELSLGSNEIDLKEKKAYTDPTSPIAKVYKNFLKQNFKKYLPDMSKDEIEALSPQRASEIVKMITEQKNAEQSEAINWARLAQADRLANDSIEARKELQTEKIKDKNKEKAKLSDKQTLDIANLDQALDQMGIIEVEKGNIDTGPVSSRRNAVAQFFGVDDSQVTSFRARVGSQLADYIKSISGAAVSDNERKFLLQNMPTLGDSDKSFIAKLNMVKDRLRRNRDIYVTNLERKGKNIEEFTNPATPSEETQAASPKSPDSGPMGEITERNGKKYKWNPSKGKYQPLE
jgi:hypothetical protein